MLRRIRRPRHQKDLAKVCLSCLMPLRIGSNLVTFGVGEPALGFLRLAITTTGTSIFLSVFPELNTETQAAKGGSFILASFKFNATLNQVFQTPSLMHSSIRSPGKFQSYRLHQRKVSYLQFCVQTDPIFLI